MHAGLLGKMSPNSPGQSGTNVNWKDSLIKNVICPIEAHQIILYDNIFVILYNLSNPTVYLMYQQFNIQQLYALPTLYCVLYLSENKQRLVPLTA